MTQSKFKALNPKVVLGVAAHPDDLDFGAAGTMAKWARGGAEVSYLILTDGSRGSANRKVSPEELVKTRKHEQEDAAKVLGVKNVFFCKWEDCCLECHDDVKREIVREIRELKPDVVVTMDPTMIYAAEIGFINHSDHRAAGQATLDAVFPLARDHLSFPELLKEGLEPHNTPTLLLINLEKQNWFEDISNQVEAKLKALQTHQSQLPEMEQALKMIKELAVDMGKKAGCEFAEGFMRIDIR